MSACLKSRTLEGDPSKYTVGIAQLVRAPVCGTGGWGFKSPYSPFFLLRALRYSASRCGLAIRRLGISAIGHFGDWAFRRLGISAIGHFGDWAIRRLGNSAIGQFRDTIAIVYPASTSPYIPGAEGR